MSCNGICAFCSCPCTKTTVVLETSDEPTETNTLRNDLKTESKSEKNLALVPSEDYEVKQKFGKLIAKRRSR